MLAILFTFLAALSAVSANVSLDYPLDGQFPLIARIGENYTWTASPKTFSTDLDKSLAYSASGLPAWLKFDNRTMSFYGIPTPADEGRPPITVTASDTESIASSSFILCVTPYPTPTVQRPISQQFYAGNQALSSVFFLSPGSALATDEPTLRVPACWSFSIGLDGDSFAAENDMYYGALLSDGTPLPSWITFDTETITFDGVTPSDEVVPTPLTLEIVVFGADQQGYSAASLWFNLVVATHELSAYSTLPTVNVTAGTPFNVTITSPADFNGVLVDGQPLQPANVTVLSVDVSSYKNWLKYDPASKMLFGAPPSNFTAADGKPDLPVTLTTNFNQTLYTSVTLDIVASYFSESDLGTIRVDPGQTLQFNLAKFFANASAQHTDANLSASFNPPSASAFLNFNPVTAQLTGQIPANSDISKIGVTFVAYSHITHSTSHAMLSVVSPELESIKGSGPGGAGAPSKTQATLIVSLVFGIIGGVFFLGFALALFRRCARVKDSAILGEEGTRAWTEEEKRWYGIGIEVRDQKHEHGYGWSTQADTSAISEKGSLETQAKEGSSVPGYYPPTRSYDNLGLGLRRVSPRAPTTPSTVQASCAEGVMKKAEFLGRIRNTARNVSDRYKRRSPPARPNISHPVPLARRGDLSGMPIEGQYVEIVQAPPHVESATSIRDDHLTERRASTVVSFTTSPSNSTGERSIPRRRADFAPPNSPRGPRVPAPAAVRDRRSLVRESLQSTSGVSADSHPESLRPGEERPRLKQFTHASRVPPPRSPSSNVAEPEASSGTRRIASQTAQVYKESQEGRHTSIDELRIGMHYVRTLGEGTSNVRSTSDKSFSSLESSQQGHGATPNGTRTHASLRFLVRAGERFKFRVPMQPLSQQYRKLEARLMSGRALPPFMQAELKGFWGKGDEKKAVEFYGVPSEKDIGELHVGVFNAEGSECLARVVVEVIARGSKKTPPMAG
ncbi:hypothetical protein JVT61DRAFT_4074 [Boletus reticuloceps]|uniref:Dystroglycan-type cadherin-like domain-containing protein n=1 Tax=Boletus reticuloceps TaxID=495285 RepID=A0A8I2YLH2_9AGAM|nr:hypothetical protein JVT61DRAFT_4074 [Boletus reticuloceps]